MAQARLVSSRPLGRAVLPSVDAVVARVRPAEPVTRGPVSLRETDMFRHAMRSTRTIV